MLKTIEDLSKQFLPGTTVKHTLYDNSEKCLESLLIYQDLPSSLLGCARKRKIEYLAGRKAVIDGFSDIGFNSQTPEIGEKGAPKWPKGSSGSISHAKGLASAVVAKSDRYCQLGIDTELIVDFETAQRISRKILTRSELAQYSSLRDQIEFSTYLSLVFSAKESLYKMLHPLVGRFFSFDAAEVLELDLSTSKFEIRMTRKLTSRFHEAWSHEGVFSIQGPRITSLMGLRTP